MYKMNQFNTFDLDIKRVLNKNKEEGKEIGEINIYDCLKIIFNEIRKNKLWCYNCNKFQDMCSTTNIYSIGETIIFLLDRGLNFDKINTLMNIPFKIEENINLKDFNIKKSNFKLTSIVSILPKKKKYVCYFKSPIDNYWYLANDDNVNCITFKIIEKNHSTNDNNEDFNNPCILFYKKI